MTQFIILEAQNQLVETCKIVVQSRVDDIDDVDAAVDVDNIDNINNVVYNNQASTS